MSDKLTIYILGDYKSGAADGLAEFSYQNVQLLKDEFSFHFIEFDNSLDENFKTSEFRDDIEVHRFGSKGILVFQLPGSFRSWLRGLPKDNTLFHLSHIYNINNYLIAKILNRAGIPYLITPHDSYVYCPAYLSDRVFFKRWFRKLLVQICDKYVLDHARLIHGLTQQCPPCLRLVSRSPVMVVGNQVADMKIKFDVSIIRPQVCFVGRFDIFQKGIDRILAAFGLFKKNSKYKDVNFTLVGPVTPGALGESKQITRKQGLQVDRDVIFTGMISEAGRNDILASSKVYLQLSRYEGFGLSIIEALSCFKPVIISREVPISNRILNYNAGFIVNDPQEAADALAAIFDLPPDEYESMAMNARRCYEEQFHPDIVKPQLIELYKKAIKE